jgi:hypothetical protein
MEKLLGLKYLIFALILFFPMEIFSILMSCKPLNSKSFGEEQEIINKEIVKTANKYFLIVIFVQTYKR